MACTVCDALVSVPREQRQFFGLVNQAFSSRRKMLRNNLKGTYSTDSAERALREVSGMLALPQQCRPSPGPHHMACQRTLAFAADRFARRYPCPGPGGERFCGSEQGARRQPVGEPVGEHAG